MSKVVVYVLDSIVWMLLITVFTTQALQIAGFMDSPKGLPELTYTQDREYNFQLGVGVNDARGKRAVQASQHTQDRSQFLDNLFNIPISALNALNNMIQSSRPAFQKFRDYAKKRLEKTTSTTKSPDYDSNKTIIRLQRAYPVYVPPQKTELES